MAYARFNQNGKSEVYVFGTLYQLECCVCRLTPVGDWFGFFATKSRTAMIKHLQDHRQVGHYVPWSATRRLKREAKEEGDEYR